ncbi:MAG: glycosyltransferase family 4 protein [Fimbriimonas ginsengisoli]|uniref:Glycosyltransferase family 4 protein n=1 Tax=Fimbriimonas ginsengisoli TaxID=1005039 RepID=A0A931LR89_FIMGI|nr:glycosyltransferase family 4 protein [Fimbriimonas ginsengisoli]
MPESRMTVAMAGMPALVAGGSRMDTRRGLGHGESDFAVGFFGRLVAEKGVHVLMGAAYQLPDVRFEIFGDGPSRRSLEAGAAMAGLAGVRLRGYVSDVAEAMAAMDAIAIPSVWVEAFGYSALEAMSLGVPVVASRRGGLAEIIEHERTGLLFEPGDAGALAAAISRLREDPAFRDSLGAAGAEAQRAEYSVEKMAERVEAVYLKLSPARRLHS